MFYRGFCSRDQLFVLIFIYHLLNLTKHYAYGMEDIRTCLPFLHLEIFSLNSRYFESRLDLKELIVKHYEK